jgi:DNA polymerase-3 subunit gamma/tau
MAKKKTTTKKSTSTSTSATRKAELRSDAVRVDAAHATPVSDTAYTVLARRYRPQQFEDVVGQEAIARALSGAIRAGRVAHAYLFSGARGVGKTSTARILAKALNCDSGPTSTPCGECDACVRIASGDDIDVLEIDGASNRGIDEIRNLRQNVSFRPSRSRYKVYIIDEVHMLTREAFNALLKTLEEPPEHVKFFFCTTEPHRLPDTIRSRCQRFDFGGISTESIAARLEQIAEAEGVKAEPEALELLARRGAGSMRDAQSLMDQLLAFGGETLTAAEVHTLLGTASDERVIAMIEALAARDPAAVLENLQSITAEGVQAGEIVDQLLDFYRDLMVLCFPGDRPNLVAVSPAQKDEARQLAEKMGLATIQAAMEILAQTKTRLRGSTFIRTLVEMGLVRIATLEDLESLAEIVDRLRSSSDGSGGTAAGIRPSSPTPKKKLDPLPRRSPPASPADRPIEVSAETAQAVWQGVLQQLEHILAEHARLAGSVELDAAGQLVVFFDARYNFNREYCQRPDCLAQIQAALERVTGSAVPLRWEVREPVEGSETSSSEGPARDGYRERLAQAIDDPLVAKAMSLFEAKLVHIDDARDPS